MNFKALRTIENYNQRTVEVLLEDGTLLKVCIKTTMFGENRNQTEILSIKEFDTKQDRFILLPDPYASESWIAAELMNFFKCNKIA